MEPTPEDVKTMRRDAGRQTLRLIKPDGGGVRHGGRSSEVPRVPVVPSAGVRPAVHAVPLVSVPRPVPGRALAVPGGPATQAANQRVEQISNGAKKKKKIENMRHLILIIFIRQP